MLERGNRETYHAFTPGRNNDVRAVRTRGAEIDFVRIRYVRCDCGPGVGFGAARGREDGYAGDLEVLEGGLAGLQR